MLTSEVPINELDTQMPLRPSLRVITADDPNPHERDDGISVISFRNKPGLFRVAVFVADPSEDYNRDDVYRQALEKTEAEYWAEPDGSRGYNAMISPKVIRKHEFTKGAKLSALAISFTIGPDKPPSETEISFEEVEIVSNLDFRGFAKRCQSAKGAKRYGEVSQLIKHHLGYNSGFESHQETAATVVISPSGKPITGRAGENIRLKGSKINEAYMIAANCLVGREMARLDLPAIYRVCDPNDRRFIDITAANRAMYSMQPGRHDALGLDLYCRVTSPLRRGTDLVMGNILKKISLGQSINARDMRDMVLMTQRSNQKILAGETQRKFQLPKPVLTRAALAPVSEVA